MISWVIKTPCLIYFRSVKFHHGEETHMMLVAFWLWWKLLQHLSTKDNERNFCRDFSTKTPTQTWKCTSCTMLMSYLYASDFHSKKLLQSRQTSRNKTIKNRVWLWLSIVFETHKLTRHQSRAFSRTTFLYRTNAKDYAHSFTLTSTRADIFIHSAKLKSCFRPWKTHLFH